MKDEIVGPWTDGDPRAREGGGIVRRRGLVQDCNDSLALWVLFSLCHGAGPPYCVAGEY